MSNTLAAILTLLSLLAMGTVFASSLDSHPEYNIGE